MFAVAVAVLSFVACVVTPDHALNAGFDTLTTIAFDLDMGRWRDTRPSSLRAGGTPSGPRGNGPIAGEEASDQAARADRPGWCVPSAPRLLSGAAEDLCVPSKTASRTDARPPIASSIPVLAQARCNTRFALCDRGQEVAQTGLFRKRNKLQTPRWGCWCGPRRSPVGERVSVQWSSVNPASSHVVESVSLSN